VEDREGLPLLVFHLVLGLQLLLGIEAVAHGARIGVGHREELDRPLLLGREQSARFVGEGGEAVLHHLLEEGAFEFDHRRC
jgi:hypothetical protein